MNQAEPTNPGIGLRHMPQLDALRAFAVFPVLVEHYVRNEHGLRAALPWGQLGVRLFFVLSGFLITGILFRSRAQLESRQETLGSVLRTFFARRFIRLMPVYYAYLGAIAVMMPPVREHLWAFLLYLQNFLFAWDPSIFARMLAHFWSLAVEEQFYLCWPFIVLLAPRAKLPAVLAAIALSGPVLRGVGLLAGLSPLAVDMMMPAHFDTLGLGGLVAVLGQGDERERAWGERLLRVAPWVGFPIAVFAFYLEKTARPGLSLLLTDLGMGLFFAWVITRAASGFGGPVGKMLDARVPQYLGKISYGIYVYHFNVPGLVRDKIAPRLGVSVPENPWLGFLVYSAVTVGVAAASWHLMEQPVNRLKKRFAYKDRAATA